MSSRNVKFNQDYTVKDAEGKKYVKDKTYSMSEASANHFAKRGIAEKIKNDAEKKAEKQANDALKKANDAAQLAEDVAAAAGASKDANLAVIDAENDLANADDKDKEGAAALLKDAKKVSAEASKNLKELEK